MKKILITGAGSYIGTAFERYLAKWPENYTVDTLDMLGDAWRQADFSGYDAVLHVAGIVHQAKTKNDPSQAALYRQVNTDLAIETAQKAKAAGVGQFLFMSSASVYGLTARVGQQVTITADTPLAATDNYGLSKVKAEEGLTPLADDSFRVAILRPPMIYGKGCRGNYVTLSKLARKLPLFPEIKNQRSMLYIDNLSECLRLLVDEGAGGIFCPQDSAYVNTSDMVRCIATVHGKRLRLVRGFTWALRLLSHVTDMVDKAFGSLCYDPALSARPANYQVVTLQQAIQATEAE